MTAVAAYAAELLDRFSTSVCAHHASLRVRAAAACELNLEGCTRTRFLVHAYSRASLPGNEHTALVRKNHELGAVVCMHFRHDSIHMRFRGVW